MKSYILILTLLWSFSAFPSPILPIVEGPQVQRKILSAAEVAALPAHIQSQLQTAAIELAQIWGDTILEGDYEAAEEVRIDQVERLYLSLAFVAYRISYSSEAFETSSGSRGRIVESGFLSSDFKQISRDAAAFARFIENSN